MIQKSLNMWSFPGGLEGTLCPFDFIKHAHENGFAAVELCIGEGTHLDTSADEDFCRRLAKEASDFGMSIPSTASGLYWSRALGDTTKGAREQALEDLKKMLQISSWLGAKTHLTIPGAVEVFFLPDRPIMPYDEVFTNAVSGLREALAVAERVEVRMGIENVWNKFLLSPVEMAEFIDQFESPWIGAYLDVANILPYGYPEQWLRILGSRVVGVHFKDFRKSVGTIDGFVDLLEGDVNWPEVMAALREIDYDGPVVAEMIPYYRHCPEVRIANTSRAMDAILSL
ncbi:MAG TPA: sugar phosphate isomerase/epimerase family protein [Fimbriimonadaceae bacterium]|nr:sugar phosphate isomerase/epimerase family protein [Fimbriimonadaceae bacterium]